MKENDLTAAMAAQKMVGPELKLQALENVLTAVGMLTQTEREAVLLAACVFHDVNPVRR